MNTTMMNARTICTPQALAFTSRRPALPVRTRRSIAVRADPLDELKEKGKVQPRLRSNLKGHALLCVEVEAKLARASAPQASD